MGSVKYDKSMRRKVRGRIRQLLREGLRAKAISEQMSAEGFKAPDGGEFTEKVVQNQATAMKVSTRVGRRILKKQPSEQIELNDEGGELFALCELIIQSNFNESRKINMLRAAIRDLK